MRRVFTLNLRFVQGLLALALGLSTFSSARATDFAKYARAQAKEAGILLGKDRSLINVAAGMAFYSDEKGHGDPVIGLQLNVAPVSFVNLEVGVGGNNDQITSAVWNDFFSYFGAGIAYMFLSVSGEDADFEKLHDKLAIDVRDERPYKNSAFWGGAYLVPLPFIFFQPQFGIQAVRLKVANKGEALQTYTRTKILPTVGLEFRTEESFFGFRMAADIEDIGKGSDSSEESGKWSDQSKKNAKQESVGGSLGFYLGANL